MGSAFGIIVIVFVFKSKVMGVFLKFFLFFHEKRITLHLESAKNLL